MPISLIMFVALFAIGVDNYVIFAILPQIGADLGEAIAIVGLLASAYALPNALLAPLLGPLSDRFGRKLVMSLGMAGFLAAVIASALAPNFGFLLAARVVNGLCAAVVLPAAFAYATDNSSARDRPRAISTLFTAYPASNLVGVPLGGFAAALLSWRGAFWVVAALAILSLVFLLQLSGDRPKTGEGVGYRRALATVLGSPRSLAIVGVTAVWFTAGLGNFTYISEFFQSTYGLSVDQAGLVFIIVGVVGVLATRVGGRVIGRIGARRAVMGGMSAYIAAVVILPRVAGSLPLALVIFAVWVFGVWFGLPALQSIVSTLHDEARGTALAFNQSALYLGGVIGPALSGAVLGASGFIVLGMTNAAIALGALALAWFVLPGSPAAVDGPGSVAV